MATSQAHDPDRPGVTAAEAVAGDLYDLVPGGHAGRRSEDEVTIYQNGGGAHFDLMIARRIAGNVNSTRGRGV